MLFTYKGLLFGINVDEFNKERQGKRGNYRVRGHFNNAIINMSRTLHVSNYTTGLRYYKGKCVSNAVCNADILLLNSEVE